MKSLLVPFLFLFTTLWAQDDVHKYSWQKRGTHCNESMSFCWYGSEVVSNPEVIAYGNHWVSEDKDEKPFEWITQVRCVHNLKVCILARNQKLAGASMTNTDLYRVEEWNAYQIRAIGESDWPQGKECEIDSLLLNRAEGSVSMLSVPGPGAASKVCGSVMKPKTVIYKLELSALGSVERDKPSR